ncbi:DUF4876 domain-containing protein [Flavobacterium agricola]|uniref:DUF4876 domain-containing protein n=1 Tax=Flavobacterium agricola TaxID=2870839 RepID=A0ABY6LZ59_9FLAO|nr:DUF4876 domain-containing protein [Flavobacterium agricola]UYW01612.1 DUF4876 domain-containing protein [Flavobacterium agricola]
MKKIALLLTAGLAAWGCAEDDFGTTTGGLTTVPYSLTAVYEPNIPAANASITLVNINTNDSYELVTDENGFAYVANLLPGTYNISGSNKLNNEQFETIFGYAETNDEINFNGNLNNTVINANFAPGKIKLAQAKTGNLVIKQVYYAGSDALKGAVMRDQFIEIYNNSNQLLYADGLYIALLHGATTLNPSAANAPYTLSSGQWDWSKSSGMSIIGGDANTDYVYADYVVQIPGNGSQYPIEPGKSIVIAQTGINHKQPLSNDGKDYKIDNPDLTVDLSEADFEAYLGDFRKSIGKEPFASDIENPAVPNVNIAFWGIPGAYFGNTDLILNPQGTDSFVIFKDEDFILYKFFPLPNVVNVSGSTPHYIQIPVNKIIDGVDAQHFRPSSARPKMLPSHIDATSISVSNQYNSSAIIRKIKSTTPDGRIILQDTNNSNNDFIEMKANPKGFATN